MGYKNYQNEPFIISSTLARCIECGRLEIWGIRKKVSIRKDSIKIESTVRRFFATLANNYRCGGRQATLSLTRNGKLRKKMLQAFLYRICCGIRVQQLFSEAMEIELTRLAKKGFRHRIFSLEHIRGEIILRAHHKIIPQVKESTWVKATVRRSAVELR